MKIFWSSLLAVLLCGCATKNNNLYEWGGYDDVLYQAYKEPATTAVQMQKLEAHIGKLEQGKQKIAPGLYADLGTFYMQAGDKDKALLNFRKERDAWPESATLMDAMIKNLETQKSKGTKS
jgi:hypothetical protein